MGRYDSADPGAEFDDLATGRAIVLAVLVQQPSSVAGMLTCRLSRIEPGIIGDPAPVAIYVDAPVHRHSCVVITPSVVPILTTTGSDVFPISAHGEKARVGVFDAAAPIVGPGRLGAMVPAASAVICDDTGRVLLVLRGREPEKGRWSVPGGRVEPGETFAQAAAREAFEETGLHVEIGRELWTVAIAAADGQVFDVHDFAATIAGGVLSPGDDAEDARWFTPAELDTVPLTNGLRGYLARAGVIPGTARKQ